MLSLTMSAPSAAQDLRDLPTYETAYYVIHTDLAGDDVREAGIRMTRMAEEYHQRTRAFAGAIRQKLDFYLFKDPQNYYDAGGVPGSAGVFVRDRLMAIAGNDVDGDTWHVVQHEGFHQFADAVIGGDIPIWINEGLAEYFGEALFTGDQFITGIIPPWRLERVKESIKNHQFMPLQRMMHLSHLEWNQNISIANYDQAWTMVHFLAHGENGAYQNAFSQFMTRIGKGQKWTLAWNETFGDPAKFEERWQKWWTELPDGPTAELYHRATVLTITGFLARATAQQQKFSSFDEFAQAAERGALKCRKEDWLPPRLLSDAMLDARAGGGTWTIDAPSGGKPATVSFRCEDGSTYVGHFTLSAGRVKKTWVDVDNSTAR